MMGAGGFDIQQILAMMKGQEYNPVDFTPGPGAPGTPQGPMQKGPVQSWNSGGPSPSYSNGPSSSPAGGAGGYRGSWEDPSYDAAPRGVSAPPNFATPAIGGPYPLGPDGRPMIPGQGGGYGRPAQWDNAIANQPPQNYRGDVTPGFSLGGGRAPVGGGGYQARNGLQMPGQPGQGTQPGAGGMIPGRGPQYDSQMNLLNPRGRAAMPPMPQPRPQPNLPPPPQAIPPMPQPAPSMPQWPLPGMGGGGGMPPMPGWDIGGGGWTPLPPWMQGFMQPPIQQPQQIRPPGQGIPADIRNARMGGFRGGF